MSVSQNHSLDIGAREVPRWPFRLILASAFTAALAWTYVSAIAPSLTYLGFSYFQPDQNIFLLAAAAAVFPALLLPRSAQRPGDFVIWILYFGLYIPSVALPPLMGRLSDANTQRLIIALGLAFLIICIPPLRKSRSQGRALISIKRSFFWNLFFLGYVGLNLWVLIAFHGHLRLVGLGDVYDQRAASNDVLEGSLIGYVAGALSGAFNPFLMAYGISRRRYGLLALGAGGQVLIFATAALKSVMVSVIIVSGFYFLLFRKRENSLIRVGYAFCIPAVLLALLVEQLYRPEASIVKAIFSLVYMRAFCMPGVLTGVYTEFFLTHPLTYFSHIGLLRSVLTYPYGDALGNVIGSFMLPIGVPMDANASFLMTDGMAALGFPGIVLAGFFMRSVIAFFNGCIKEVDIPIACCSVVPALITAMNTSLFSTMLTGGAAVLLLILYFFSNSIPDRTVGGAEG